MTVEDSVILKYEQTLSVCFVGQVCREGGAGVGEGVLCKPVRVCVLGKGCYCFSLWLEKPYLQKHRKKGLLAK